MGFKLLLRRLKRGLIPSRPYAISVHQLIKDSEQHFWSHVGFQSPSCPICAEKLMFRSSNLSRDATFSFREDQCWKCPKCFITLNFGVPMTKEEWRKALARRGGYLLMRPDIRESERGQKEVLERLRALGYLG